MQIRPFIASLPKNPSPQFFKTVRKLDSSRINWQDFHTTSTESFIIYHLQTPLHTFRGIVALTAIDDFANFRVLPHEKTLLKKEVRTLARLRRNKGMYKPILLTYQPNDSVSELCMLTAIDSDPDYIYEDDTAQSRHLMWLVKDAKTQKILQQEFQKIDRCYLADGHHRAKSLLRWRKKKKCTIPCFDSLFQL